jgi:hypothetical protein
MDEPSSLTPGEARATRREVLLRRLAETLDEMRRSGVLCPAALEDLVLRHPPRRQSRD